MKSFDWKSFLKQHPIFKCLSEDDIDQLLKDEASEERVCPKDSVIIREGEVENSVFLIGTGSIRVALQVKDGHEINLSVLKKEGFFGEMALIEEKPRSATVIAQEDSTLLEVKGKEFSKIIENYSGIAFKVLLKLSERLRGNERLMAMKLKDVDEKINLFNTKLDAELKAVDAHLKASLTVFDQTKMRTDEVIDSAERSRSRLTIIASIIGIVITAFGFFGIKEFVNIKNLAATAKNLAATAKNEAKIVTEAKLSVEKLGSLYLYIDETRTMITQSLLRRVNDALKKKDTNDLFMYYNQLQEFSLDDTTIARILYDIQNVIVVEKSLTNYTDFLWLVLEDSIKANMPAQVITAYFLLLTDAIIVDDKSLSESENEMFESTLSDFQQYVAKHEDRLNNTILNLTNIDLFFKQVDKGKQERFQRVIEVVTKP